MKKRILSIITVLALCLSLLPTTAWAVTEDDDSGTSTDSVTYMALAGTAGVPSDGSEDSDKLFDGNTETKWCVTVQTNGGDDESTFQSMGGAYMIFRASASIKVSGCTMTTGGDTETYPERNPTAWELYGRTTYSTSTDLSGWSKIYSVKNDTSLGAENKKDYTFNFDESAAYQYFMLHITDINEDNVDERKNTLQLSGFSLTVATVVGKGDSAETEKADGVYTVKSGTAVLTATALTDVKELVVKENATVILAGDVSLNRLDNSGTVTINTGCTSEVGSLDNRSSGSLTNYGTLTCDGTDYDDGEPYFIVGGTLTNYGTLTVKSSDVSIGNNRLINEGSVTIEKCDSETSYITNKGALIIKDSSQSVFYPTGSGIILTIDGSTGTVTGGEGTLTCDELEDVHDLTIASGAAVTLEGDSWDSITLDKLTNSGTLMNNSYLYVYDTLTNNGTVMNDYVLQANTLDNCGTLTNADILQVGEALTNKATLTNDNILVIMDSDIADNISALDLKGSGMVYYSDSNSGQLLGAYTNSGVKLTTVNDSLDFTSETNIPTGEGFNWDTSSKTLTLNNVVIGDSLTLPSGSTIVVSDVACVADGVYCNGTLTIENGTLITSGIASAHSNFSDPLTIKNATVNVTDYGITWDTTGGVVLVSSTLNSTGEYGSIHVGKLTMDDSSTIFAKTGIGGYSWADLSGILSYLPEGYTIGVYTPNHSDDLYILDASGNIATNFTIKKRTSNSGNFGGSSSSSGSHRVVIEADAENGTIKADKTSASSGEHVTLTVTPDEGYQLESLTVTDSKGNSLPLTEKDGKYTFQMPGTAVTITATFVTAGHTCPSEAFSDVDTNKWYHEAVDYALTNKLMSGYGNGTFGPENYVTRAMLAQILYNREGKPMVDFQLDFTDVPENAWYAKAVRWAASEGIVVGYVDGKFGPNDKITREQLAVMLWRYAGSSTATQETLRFTDADQVGSYAKQALLWANANGIVNGYSDGTLKPQGLATRVQVAQMLMNFCKTL